jgi:hypothetical protein
MEIRETEDDPDVRLLADFTGAGLGSWWTSTRNTNTMNPETGKGFKCFSRRFGFK